MGLIDRDYMNNRDSKPRRTGGRNVASRRRGSMSVFQRSMAWLIVILVVYITAKFLMEKKHAKPFPESGTVQWYTIFQSPKIAMLTLTAPAHSKRNFAVLLDDWATASPVALIHVRGGESSVTLMPLGRYRMTVAKGSTWLGSGRLFGIGGEIQEAVDPIEFHQAGNQITGHRIELETIGGNMEMQPGHR